MFAYLRDELQQLDQSTSKLRWFGWLFTGLLAIIATWLGAKIPTWQSPAFLIAPCCVLLFWVSWRHPSKLRCAHRYWMAFALCLGWLVSRTLLILLFFMVVVPTGLAGRVFGWRFMQMRRVQSGASLWIDKPPRERAHHDKLY
jgi:hypothetical protein